MTPATAQVGGVVELRGVSLAYGRHRVLEDIDLSLPRGAVVGLIGSNGAGKSSLMRAMVGLGGTAGGRLAVFDEDPMAFTDAARARIGYVAQSPELIEWMSVGQHLDYIGAFYPAWDGAAVARLTERWQLDRNERIARLSLGAKQKLSLLLALGHAPELLVLDEPVASLDPLARREFMRSLFGGDGARTVVISSHLLLDLQRVISHVAFLKDGRLLMFDEWDALIESLRLVWSPTALPAGDGLLTRRSDDDGHRAVIDLRRYPAERLPSSAVSSTPTLDDLFVEIMS
jgi:ABC-2 type transport system ATP-binding protein